MKKLLFVLLMVVSGQVMAAQEFSVSYIGMAPGRAESSLIPHVTGCIPTVLSLESGNSNVAIWITQINIYTASIKVANIGILPETGTAKMRLGPCQ